MAVLDKKRRGELLRAVFDVLADHPDGIQAKDALAEVEKRIELTDQEKGFYPGPYRRGRAIAFPSDGATFSFP